LTIGIGGISRSGKTKLAKRLRTYFKKQGYSVILFSTDDFMYNPENLPVIRGYLNREIPEAINFGQLTEQIETAYTLPNTIVIVEGHLITLNIVGKLGYNMVK